MTIAVIVTILLSVTSLAFLIRAIAFQQWRTVSTTLLFVVLGIGGGLFYPGSRETEVQLLGRAFASGPLFAYMGAVFGGTLGLIVSAIMQRDESTPKQ